MSSTRWIPRDLLHPLLAKQNGVFLPEVVLLAALSSEWVCENNFPSYVIPGFPTSQRYIVCFSPKMTSRVWTGHRIFTRVTEGQMLGVRRRLCLTCEGCPSNQTVGAPAVPAIRASVCLRASLRDGTACLSSRTSVSARSLARGQEPEELGARSEGAERARSDGEQRSPVLWSPSFPYNLATSVSVHPSERERRSTLKNLYQVIVVTIFKE